MEGIDYHNKKINQIVRSKTHNTDERRNWRSWYWLWRVREKARIQMERHDVPWLQKGPSCQNQSSSTDRLACVNLLYLQAQVANTLGNYWNHWQTNHLKRKNQSGKHPHQWSRRSFYSFQISLNYEQDNLKSVGRNHLLEQVFKEINSWPRSRYFPIYVCRKPNQKPSFSDNGR